MAIMVIIRKEKNTVFGKGTEVTIESVTVSRDSLGVPEA